MTLRTILACVLLLVTACASRVAGPQAADTNAAIEARIARLLKAHPLVDGHNDLIINYHYCGKPCPRGLDAYDISAGAEGETDIARWRQGGVGGQLLNAGWLAKEPGLDGTLKGLAFVRSLAERYPRDLAIAGTAAEVRAIHADGRIALVLALENPGRLGTDEATVKQLAAAGVRANILAYDEPTDLADGHAGPAKYDGLSPAGVTMVGWMERYGVLVDLSHASVATARDVLDVARAPVIFSHSNAAALADVPRNVPDDVLRRLPANGGMVMVGFVPYFTSIAFDQWMKDGDRHFESLMAQNEGSREKAGAGMDAWVSANPPPTVTIADVADHIEHIRDVAGIDHVGLGADFDGIAFNVTGLEDVATYPRLLEALARRGWSDEDLAKLAGGNFLRVLAAADAAAGRITQAPAAGLMEPPALR